jgi:hypothetical protein
MDSSWLYFVWDDFDYFGKENEMLENLRDALKLKFNIKFTERSKKFVGYDVVKKKLWCDCTKALSLK